MKNSYTYFLGLIASILAITILLGFFSDWLSFRVLDPTLLWMGKAFFIAIGTLLNIILVWMLHREFRTELSRLSQFVFLTGMLGSVIALIGSSFGLLNTIVGHALIIWFPLSQTQSIIVFGYGFIGIWLLLLNYDARMHDAWQGSVAWLGIITGMIMAAGLLALPRIFIPYVSLYHQLVPELAELVGNLGWMIVYPIWLIWFGSVAGKAQSRGQPLRGFV